MALKSRIVKMYQMKKLYEYVKKYWQIIALVFGLKKS
jgi:hypothetical protein